MFIREFTTKKKEKTYTNHKLVESYRDLNNQPRQRIIMSLGTLSIPKDTWKEFAILLEQRIVGQTTFKALNPELESLADEIYARGKFSKAKTDSKVQAEQKRDIVNVDLNSIQTTRSRSIGAELVAKEMFENLELGQALGKLGFSLNQISVAQALILGKLINPASELATWRWFNERSCLSEMQETDIHGIGKDIFYEVGDLLFTNRKEIEQALYNRETTLFSLDRRLFLFDLTNTYLEGSAKSNDLAHFGISKEKRKDCPLVSLAFMVDEKGFPVYSRICQGNQSEPQALQDVLDDLRDKFDPKQIPDNFTLVMDRGIATKSNLALIKDYGYTYTVIERSPVESSYTDEFAELKQLLEKDNQEEALTAAGWETIRKESGVYAKHMLAENATRALVLSIAKEAKELSMNQLKESRFLTDIEKLKKSVEAGNIKLTHKVSERIGRIRQKYAGIANYYEIDIILSSDQKSAKSITWTKQEKGKQRPILAGCYVLETNREDISAKDIWNDYMTITRVEGAFRDLKSELGLRPIYHHSKERTEAHLFIGVLAYHLFVSIETVLRSAGDHREWKTVRQVLSTHQRSTVIVTGEDGTIYNIRVTGNPESSHLDIYKKFHIVDFVKRKKVIVNERK